MKYRCVIADDSTLDRDLLEVFLEKTGEVDIVASCKDGMEAYRAIQEEDVDLVFTDLDMPHLNGLELVKSLTRQPVFVFISSHSEYAVHGFDLDVADFILKPLQFERLLRALEKAKGMIVMRQQRNNATSGSIEKIQDDHFFIRISDSLVQLYHATILYIESAGNFSKIHTTSGEVHITLVSLKNLSAQLPEDWLIRVHRQYLVNIRQISSVEQISVKVAGQHSIPLGLPYRQQLLERIASRTIQRNI